MKKILVLLGHPAPTSFCKALAQEYIDAAEKSGHEVKKLFLGDLRFDPILKNGYNAIQELEPDLVKAQELIKWCDHLVWVYPTWWASPPALMKGFIERTIVPGFGYKRRQNSATLDKFLVGKTARLIVTMNAPPVYQQVIVGDPGGKLMKDFFGLCGIRLIGKSYLGGVRNSSDAKRAQWLSLVAKLGFKGK